MELHRLGNSDLRLTPIGVWSRAIGGGGWPGSMGPRNDSDFTSAIPVALDCGMNWIDSAALYGLGHSEEMVVSSCRARAAPSMCSPGVSGSGMRRQLDELTNGKR